MAINVKSFYSRNSNLFFLIFVFIYQFIFIFQGLDFADEGFYATFYQQIFNDPQSVGFNFMYWFTGIIGGGFHLLFADTGILGQRVLGVILQTTTIAIAFNFLKNYIPHNRLKLSLLLIVLFISNDPKELYYNNLSALFYLSSAILLFKGLKYNRKWNLLLAGLFLCLNVFTRVTSIAGLTFVMAIFYYGWINRTSLKKQLVNCLYFIIGFVISTIGVIIIMKLINHLDIFVDALLVVSGMGQSDVDSHNVLNLIKLFFYDYGTSMVLSLMVSILFLIMLTIIKLYRNSRSELLIYSALLLGISVSIYYMFFQLNLSGLVLLRFLTGISLLTGLVILIRLKNEELRLLAFLGCLIVLVAPLGSAGGIFFMGRYSFWLLFPVIFDYLHQIKIINLKLNYSKFKNPVDLELDNKEVKTGKKIMLFGFVGLCLYFAYFFPYFDLNNRAKMHYSIDNKYLKGVYTSKSRAEAVSQLLTETSKYVKKDDYVFAYDSMPLFHYLTETKPYLYNSWPWAYYPEAFENALHTSLKEIKYLPVVVLQKVNTINTNWPDNQMEDYYTIKSNQKRNEVFFQFLNNHNYKKIWENTAFEIFLPTTSHYQLLSRN